MKTAPMPLLDKHAKKILGELEKQFPSAKEVCCSALSGSVIANPSQTERTRCFSIEVKIIEYTKKEIK